MKPFRKSDFSSFHIQLFIAVPVTGWSGWAGSAGWVDWAQPPAGGRTEGSDLHCLQGTSTRMEGPKQKSNIFNSALYKLTLTHPYLKTCDYLNALLVLPEILKMHLKMLKLLRNVQTLQSKAQWVVHAFISEWAEKVHNVSVLPERAGWVEALDYES